MIDEPMSEDSEDAVREATTATEAADGTSLDVRIDVGHLIEWVVGGYLAVIVAAVFLDAVVNYANAAQSGAIRRLFNMTREDAFGSWLMMTLTLVTTVTAWLNFAMARARRRGPRRVAGWLIVALFFSWLAVDDGSKVHERLGTAYEQAQTAAVEEGGELGLGGRILSWFPSYAWQVVLLPPLVAAGVFTVGFLWLVVGRRRLRRLVIFATVVFGLTVAMDFVEGLEQEHPLNVYGIAARHWEFDDVTKRWFQEDGFDTVVHFSKSFEEALEMVGMLTLWVVLFAHLTSATGSAITFRRTDDG